MQSDQRLVYSYRKTVAKMSELVWEKETVLPWWEILVALSPPLPPVLKGGFVFWSL